jgi:hypothetical protein
MKESLSALFRFVLLALSRRPSFDSANGKFQRNAEGGRVLDAT